MQRRRTSTAHGNHPHLIGRVILASVLSVALMLVGFGHKPVQAEPQAVAYLLAGGNWADLCADGDAPHGAGDICMACLVVQSVGLADPALYIQPAPSTQDAHWTRHATARRILASATPHPARAPPCVDRTIII
ncbi:hypothetical protein [Yoonia vestfoldensis]|uniref:hypothetical protein n=1 Tax=Yoonia vestfoldensis TaxID=245188 RepID=UPI00035EA9AA|nr:hypothetical protein [Yoonia vestfoldensis]